MSDVWTATTETMNPTGKSDLAASVGKTVLAELARAGFVPRASP